MQLIVLLLTAALALSVPDSAVFAAEASPPANLSVNRSSETQHTTPAATEAVTLGPYLPETTRDDPELSGVSSLSCPSGSENVAAYNLSHELTLLYLVNVERNSLGLPPLKKADELMRAARYHAWDMAITNYFEHGSYDGPEPFYEGDPVPNLVCTPGNRIDAFYPWIAYAENIAAGFGGSDPAVINQGFINSPGHYTNMQTTSCWEIGTGMYYSATSYRGYYWTEDFGRRIGVYPIVINLEAVSTASTSVNLYLYGSGTFDEMRLKNDDNAWGAWQPFQTTITGWTLPQIQGTRTVHVEMRQTWGSATASSSDDIEYTGTQCCPDCSGTTVTLENVTFPAGCECHCVATVSITAGTNVTIEAGATVTFTAPTVTLTPGFTVQAGADFTSNQTAP